MEKEIKNFAAEMMTPEVGKQWITSTTGSRIVQPSFWKIGAEPSFGGTEMKNGSSAKKMRQQQVGHKIN